MKNQLFQEILKLISEQKKWDHEERDIFLVKMVLNKVMIYLTEKQQDVIEKTIPQTWKTAYIKNSQDVNLAAVSAQITTLCNQQAPNDARISALWQSKETLEKILKEAGFLRDSPWELIIYGSTLNSVCSNDLSDLDMTLIVSYSLNQMSVLQELQSILCKHFESYNQLQLLVLPSGPILSFFEKQTATDIDISVNKILEIQNSRLIRTYAQLD